MEEYKSLDAVTVADIRHTCMVSVNQTTGAIRSVNRLRNVAIHDAKRPTPHA